MATEPTDLRSFGRRRGRKLSQRQQRLLDELLPRVRLELGGPAPVPLNSLFGTDTREVWLEIGFGAGEHLLWCAEHRSDVGLIGCEPFEEGVVKVLSGIEQRGLPNIRLWPEDARTVLRWLPQSSLARVFVLFPDPWPKKRHQKRRLLTVPTLALISRALRSGGELHIATDIPDYIRTLFMALAATPELVWAVRSPHDWRKRPAAWPSTRYEQKAVEEGRRCCWINLQKR